jgi:serine/threonine-protein kinase
VPAAASPSVAATPAPTSVVVTAPVATEATFTIRAEPASAKLFLDGAQLATNPFKRTFPRDGASHTLRAEAMGFVTKSQTVTADADRDVVLALDRIGVAAKYPVATPPVTATTPTAPTATPIVEAKPTSSATGKKPPKAIDTVNPWD